MPLLPGPSIRSRVLLIILLGFLTLATFLGWMLFHEVKLLQRDFVSRTETMAQLIGENVAPFLESRNQADLKKRLQLNQTSLSLESIYIFDANGNLFLAYPGTLPESTPYGWLSRRAEFSEDALHVVEPILKENQRLGSVYVKASTKELHKRVKNHFLAVFSFLIIILGFSVFIVFTLRRAIAAPIAHLANTMREIPESVVSQTATTLTQDDQIGDLYSGFDKMRRKIERREIQRDRAEAALQESERRYRNLVESSPDAIFLQQDGKVVYMNPSGLKLLGFESEADIRGKDIFSFLSRSALESSHSFETKFVRPDGKIMDVNVVLIEITHEGAPATQGILRDITEHKQLREMSERMKRLAGIGELSAQIAHEIRNSIGSLQLNLRNLTDHIEILASREKAITNMQLGIQRMEEIVTGILNFAKPNPPLLKKVSVRVILESTLKSIEKELEESHILVVRNFDDSCPDLQMDSNQMHRAFMNLFRNARQAMPSGGTLTVSTKAVDGIVEIEVADTGEGIPAGDLEKIFDPFFTTKRDGTGLGLAILARTLEQHGASIFVESAPGAGTKFRIRFPIEPQAL